MGTSRPRGRVDGSGGWLLPSLILSAVMVSASAGAKEPPERLAAAALRADLALIRTSLQEGSPGLYRHIGQRDFDLVCRRAMAEVNRPLTVLEFFRIAAPVVAAVKNGHTSLRLPEDDQQVLEQQIPLLPLGVRVLGGEIFVVRDFSDISPSLAGSEVLAINGVSSRELVRRMLALVSADGDVMTSRQRMISGWGFDFQLFTTFGFRDRFSLSLRGEQGRARTVVVDGLLGKALSARWRQRYPEDLDAGHRAQFGFAFSDDRRIGVLTIPHWDDFVDADRKTDIDTFFGNVFRDLASSQSQVLIIDVRDNGGGEDAHAARLASYLVERPFLFFDDLWMKALSFSFLRYAPADYRRGETEMLPKEVADLAERGPDGRYHLVKLPYWGLQQPSAPTFRGRVLLLSNGNSFSTSTEFSAFLWSRHRVEIVGEEGSGYWRSNTSGVEPTLTLPASKLRLTVPLMEFDSAVSGGKPGAHGVLPDHRVSYTVADLIAGRDKEMELALRLARADLQRASRKQP